MMNDVFEDTSTENHQVARLSRAEVWAITSKLDILPADLKQFPRRKLLLELYPLAYKKLAMITPHAFVRRQRTFINQCYRIRDSCTLLQRKLLIYLATTGDMRISSQIDVVKSHTECFTCENSCCIISVNNGSEMMIKCPFLIHHRCRVYDVRPELCRTFTCPEIIKLPSTHSLVRLRSEFYGDSSVGKICEDECYTFAIPKKRVDAAMAIRLAYGINHPTREGLGWNQLRQLGALEIKRDTGCIRYAPI